MLGTGGISTKRDLARRTMKRIFSDRALLGIVFAGFALRCAWVLLYPEVLENEGAVYAGLSQNLFAGKGYLWPFGGRYTLFPPLYPVLIGAVSLVTGAATDTACRVVSLAAGAMLPVPVFLVTEILFDRRAAHAASALVAVHPMFIALSGTAYSEMTYFAIWFLAIYFALRAVRSDAFRHAALAGLFFGMAYLVRPQAVAYSLLTATWIILMAIYRRSELRNAFLRAATVILVTAALAAPYSAWLSINSGKFLLEGKSPIINLLSSRMAQGKSYIEAARGLGPNGEREGVFLFPDQFDLVRGDTTAGRSLLSSVFFRFRHRVRELWKEIWTLNILGSPALPFLAAAGFLAWPLRRRQFPEELFVASFIAAYVFILLSVQWRWVRYLFPLALLLVPWAGAGMCRISGWIGERVETLKGRGSFAARLGAGVSTGLFLAAMTIPCVPAVLESHDFYSARFTALRDGGRWLDSRSEGRKTIMCNSIVLAFYSGGTGTYIPYAPEKDALEYMHRKMPDYVVLRSDDRDDAPFMDKWLSQGIPDPCAREIRRIRQVDELGLGTHSEEMAIYEWRCGPSTMPMGAEDGGNRKPRP
jgi:4-amino-4-deoxy-L-arabinose transferase-like glycosyltransferase